MRWKVMIGTALFWAMLHAALAWLVLTGNPIPYDPDNYESWTDFRLAIFSMGTLPLTLSGLLVTLLIEYAVMKPALPQSPA